jgi:hypothetical protein
MTVQRSKKRSSRLPREKRQDVTRLEYETLRDHIEKVQEGIRRLELQAAIQFQRTVEQQVELDALKKGTYKK